MTQSLAEMLSAAEVVDLTQPLSEDTPVLKLPPPFANTPGLTRHVISEYDDRGPAGSRSASTSARTSMPRSTG